MTGGQYQAHLDHLNVEIDIMREMRHRKGFLVHTRRDGRFRLEVYDIPIAG